MCQDSTYVDPAPIEMDGGYESEIIPPDIEHNILGNRIGMRESLPQLGYGMERGPGHDAIPREQRYATLRMGLCEFTQSPPRYDVHPNFRRHPVGAYTLLRQHNLKMR
jgi:hypothetical protein